MVSLSASIVILAVTRFGRTRVLLVRRRMIALTSQRKAVQKVLVLTDAFTAELNLQAVLPLLLLNPQLRLSVLVLRLILTQRVVLVHVQVMKEIVVTQERIQEEEPERVQAVAQLRLMQEVVRAETKLTKEPIALLLQDVIRSVLTVVVQMAYL